RRSRLQSRGPRASGATDAGVHSPVPEAAEIPVDHRTLQPTAIANEGQTVTSLAAESSFYLPATPNSPKKRGSPGTFRTRNTIQGEILMQPSDEELYRRMRKGDQLAFAELYTRREPGLHRYSLHMSGSWSVAEEVTHEAFLRLM